MFTQENENINMYLDSYEMGAVLRHQELVELLGNQEEEEGKD